MTGTTTTTNDNDDAVVADATTAHAATIVASDLKCAIKALVMREQADALKSVLMRLNGDEDGKNWEMVKREPVTLLAMLIEEYSRRLQEELLILGEEKKKENDDD